MNANTQALIQGLIPVVVPIVIAALKAEIPKLPGWSLPILSIIIGGLSDQATAAVVGNSSPWYVGAILGAAGIGVREIKDQLHQRMTDSNPSVGTGTSVAIPTPGLKSGFITTRLMAAVALAGVLAMTIVGCASFVNDAQKSIYVAATLSDGAMKSYAAWWKDRTNHVGADIPSLLTERSNVLVLSRKAGISLDNAQKVLDGYTINVGTNTSTKAVVNALIQTAVQDAGLVSSEVSALTQNQ
jgi:hypothetical protein